MPTSLRSFSKINLGLAIGPVRADGFHELLTAYQTIALHDVVTVEAQRAVATRIAITSDEARVPADARNTAWRMVEGALRRLGIAAEVHIHIAKRLPVQGGLGAGSANAAAALLGLERELGIAAGAPGALDRADRLALAAAVGSDVPLFLMGGTVLGEGRGEQVTALPDLPLDASVAEPRGIPCVISVPEIGVSTPGAFREWDARSRQRAADAGSTVTEASSADRLTGEAAQGSLDRLSLAYASAFGISVRSEPRADATRPDPSGTVGGLIPSGISAKEQTGARNSLAENSLLALVRTGIENDFEEVVFPLHPLLRSTKRLLMGIETGDPAVYAAMSGSGSALFGLYRTGEAARAAQQRVEASGVRALLTSTLTRERYWSETDAGQD